MSGPGRSRGKAMPDQQSRGKGGAAKGTHVQEQSRIQEGRRSESEVSDASASAAASASQQSHRQQFAEALELHFDASAAAGEEVPAVPVNGKTSKSGSIGRLRLRGVTRHKRTQRYESHIWECKKQIYMGGFDTEALAAKAHDIMALRCKGGTDAEVLNFPRPCYTPLLPLIARLTREDVVTALRNYSKSQTSRRMGLSPPSGVRKLSSPRATRRLPTMPRTGTAAVVAAAQGGEEGSLMPPRLSINVRHESRAAAVESGSRAGASSTAIASPRRFGGKVAPRRPLALEATDPEDCGGAAAAAARSAAGQAHSGTAASGSPRSRTPVPASPDTPFGRQGEAGAPVTPGAAAGATAGAFVATGPAGASRVLSMRWQRTPASPAAAAGAAATLAASGVVPGVGMGHLEASPAALGPAAAAVAAADAARQQYMLDLYYQHAASAQQQQALQQEQLRHYNQLLLQYQQQQAQRLLEDEREEQEEEQEDGGEAHVGSASMGASACATAAAEAEPGAEAAAPRHSLSCLDVAADMELDCPLGEPSLTFSASDDAYLFQPSLLPTGTDGCTAVEHVNGTMLFTDQLHQTTPQQVADAAEPLAGTTANETKEETKAEGAAAALLLHVAPPSPAPTPAPLALAAAASAAPWCGSPPVSLPGAVGSVHSTGSAQPVPPGPFAAAAAAAFSSSASFRAAAAAPPCQQPASPGQLITVLPAVIVPNPPPALVPAAFPYLPPPTSIASVLAASAAALQQVGLPSHQQQANSKLLQQHPSLYAALSPFALYASGTPFLG